MTSLVPKSTPLDVLSFHGSYGSGNVNFYLLRYKHFGKKTDLTFWICQTGREKVKKAFVRPFLLQENVINSTEIEEISHVI